MMERGLKFFGYLAFILLVIILGAWNAISSSADLVGYWKFDEGSGTTANDFSGNDNTGTLVNSPTWTTGKINGALNFIPQSSTVGQYVNLGDPAALQIPNEITLIAWINPSATQQGNWGYVVAKGSGITANWALVVTTNLVLNARLNGNSYHTFGDAMTANTWYHVAMTYDGSFLRIYQNSVQIFEQALITSINTNNSVAIGRNPTANNRYFTGNIDEVRIYNRALNSTEIQEIFNLMGTPDTIPPTVSITSPLNGATVSGIITVSADASDNVGVAGVQFLLDGANLGSEDTTSPYSVSWNTASALNGSHTLSARARDAAGNTATAAVTVTVSNVPDTTSPTISSVAASNIISSGATITWTTNENSDSQVEYGLTTLYGSQTTLDATMVTSHSVFISGLSTNTSYNYRVKSKDAAGNLAVSSNFAFTTQAAPPVGQIIDPRRRIDWNPGIPGGIPDRTTICATLSPGATATDINNAIASCPEGQVVFLQAGTYSISGGITFNAKNHVTLRGAGPDQTILNFLSSSACLGISADICFRAPNIAHAGNPKNADWTAGYAKGTTVITLSSTVGLQVGTLILLDQINDDIDNNTDNGELFVCQKRNLCSQEGGSTGRPAGDTYRSQIQVVRVTAINGGSVTISPGLYMPNWRAARSPEAYWANSLPITGVGIEDMTLDHRNSLGKSGIFFGSAYNSWAKNIKSLSATRNHVEFSSSKSNVVRDSYFYGTKSAASQSYGVETSATSDNLIENNIFQHITGPMILGGASTGNVFGYNFATDNFYYVERFMIHSAVHHNPGISMALFEGNDGSGFQADITHGTSHFATIFRNRYNGWEPGKNAQTTPILIYAKNRYMNVVGNVFGEPGYHTNYQAIPGDGIDGNTAIYRVGQGTLSNDGIPIPSDIFTVTSLLRWGNYDTVTNTVRFEASEVPSGISPYGNPIPPVQTLPNSYYLSARPSRFNSKFGSVSWPPIGPDVTGGNVPGVGGHAYKIPARLCFENTPLDASGILIFDADNCYTTISSSDTTPPNVSIISPSNGSIVLGVISIDATASDNIGIAGVQFKVDGSNVGAEDTISPYSVLLNTTTLTDGAYILTAVARDTSGNTATSSGVTINVNNTIPDTTPPTATATCSPSTVTTGDPFPCTCSGSDNVAVSSISESSTSGSTSDTSLIGTFTYACTVTDTSGNSASATTTYTVSPVPQCSFTNAFWSIDSTTEGQAVNLIVEGSNCDGELIDFKVWEQDILSPDDPAANNPSNGLFISGKAVSLWKAEWQCDGDIAGLCTAGNPEYYFNAILSSDNSVSIKSNLLKVFSSESIKDNDADSVPDDLDCNDNNASIGECGGCAVCSIKPIGIGSGSCIANNNACSDLRCHPGAICGAQGDIVSCASNELGIFPQSQLTTCAVSNDNGVCTPKACNPISCTLDSGCSSDSDNDGVPDAQDLCYSPNVTDVNKYGFPNPLMDKFRDHIITNLTYERLHNLTNFSIGITGIAKIDFTNEKIRLYRDVSGICEPLNLDSFIEISPGKVEIKSLNLIELNKSAVITMHNITLDKPYVIREGKRCDDCQILGYSNNTLVFSVPYFSWYSTGDVIYEVGEECGNGICDTASGEDCNTCNQDCGVCSSGGSGSVGGGGGGSGGGITTTILSLPENNYSWTIIMPEVATIIKDFNSETAVKQIQIEVNNDAQNVELTVTKYDDKPVAVSVAKSGKVYQYLQIEATNLADKLEKATIQFRVEKPWIVDNNLQNENIAVYRFDEISENWNELATPYIGEDNDHSYYSVELDRLSYFAISEKNGGTGVAPGEGEKRNLIWLWVLMTLIILIIIIALIAIGRHIREKKQQTI